MLDPPSKKRKEKKKEQNETENACERERDRERELKRYLLIGFVGCCVCDSLYLSVCKCV